MADIAAALGKVPATDRAKTTVVITTDPRRDTGPVLRAWLDRFDPSFVGLTGTDAQLAAAQRAAGVPLAEPEGTGEGYTVTHSAEVPAFSPDDRAWTAHRCPTTRTICRCCWPRRDRGGPRPLTPAGGLDAGSVGVGRGLGLRRPEQGGGPRGNLNPPHPIPAPLPSAGSCRLP
jgi:hypothetical protein